jgi:hypothetical protein
MLSTTFPALEKGEIVFQQDVSLLSERILRRRRRKSIVRSLQQLEQSIAPEERLKVTGLDKHPKLLSAWSEVKRSWHYDTDQTVQDQTIQDRTVQYLMELAQLQTEANQARQSSSI